MSDLNTAQVLEVLLTAIGGHANTLGTQDNPALDPEAPSNLHRSKKGNLNSGNIPEHGLFVVGTDTDVGKTYVGCLLVRILSRHFQLLQQQDPSLAKRVGVYKPVASGISDDGLGDPEKLREASGIDWPIARVCPQRFEFPLAPAIAARKVGQAVDDDLLKSGAAWWRGQCDLLVIEGAGGILSPISATMTVADLAQYVSYPVILVAIHRLGMINQILLSIEALQQRGLKLAAVIINQGPSEPAKDSGVLLSDSLWLLKKFCHDLPLWVVDNGGSTLSQPTT